MSADASDAIDAGPSPTDPDRLTLYRAHRVDVATQDPSVDSLLVRGDTIVATGPYRSLDVSAGSEAARVNVAGTVLPGLIDSHCHLAQVGYLSGTVDVGPRVAHDIGQMQEALSRRAADDSGWIVGHGYLDYALRERRSPTRHDLDEAVAGTPCVVYHASLHVCVVNSAGLAALGLSDATQDPAGGAYGRDSVGRLDGRLIEAPMFDLFARCISARLGHDGARMLAGASDHLATFGITGCVDANTTLDELRGLAAAAQTDALSVRVRSLCRYEDLDAVLGGRELADVSSASLAVIGAKVFADGGMSSRTAAVEPAYIQPEGATGMLLRDEASLTAAVRRCAEAGIGLGVHAQGERAIGAVLTAFGLEPASGLAIRRIEHGGAFPPALRDRAAQLGICVASQPAFLSQLGDGFLEAFGSDRAEYLYPFRSLLDAGIGLAFSSDAPVVTASPWLGMRDAVIRATESGTLIGQREALTARQAFEGYTVGASTGWGGAVGSLEAGRAADFTATDRDPMAIPPEEWPAIRVLATYVGGRARYRAPDLALGAEGD